MADIAREAYGKYLGLVDEPPAPLLMDYREVATSGRCYVAATAEGILGMVTVETADPYLVLRNLAVRPSAQGQGIGRNLVALVEEMALSAGMRGVRLWTRAEMTDNIAFYRSLQYVVTHSEQNEQAHRVFLCKDLKIKM
ncbi:GNAT family N-acetyltransferase [Streptomyces sp. TE33382]